MQQVMSSITNKIQKSNSTEKDFNNSLREHNVLMNEYSRGLINGNLKNKMQYENELSALNDKLVGLANKMFSSMSKKQDKEDVLDDKLREKRLILQQKIEDLEKERNMINKLRNTKNTLEKDFTSVNSLVDSNKIQYRLWMIGSILLLVFTIRHLLG